MKIYLIGLKNSGKTTTGKKLAGKLSMEFIDLDTLIEENDGRTVPEIYSEDGEELFRKKEQKALHQTLSMNNVVISTGGGVPRFFDNMELMKNNGTVVYLKLDEDTLVGRLKVAAQNRPIVKGKSPQEIRNYVRELLSNSEHFYLKADFVVDAKNLAPDEIVSRVLKNYS